MLLQMTKCYIPCEPGAGKMRAMRPAIAMPLAGTRCLTVSPLVPRCNTSEAFSLQQLVLQAEPRCSCLNGCHPPVGPRRTTSGHTAEPATNTRSAKTAEAMACDRFDVILVPDPNGTIDIRSGIHRRPEGGFAIEMDSSAKMRPIQDRARPDMMYSTLLHPRKALPTDHPRRRGHSTTSTCMPSSLPMTALTPASR